MYMAPGVDTMATASFQDYWARQGEWVEEPNRRRGGESGVQRVYDEDSLLYVKRQVGHIYRSPLHPFGRPTVLRERDALAGVASLNVRVPTLRFCEAQRDQRSGWQALLVTESLAGFEEYEQWVAEGGREQTGEWVHERFLQDLAQNLARMHRGRWQHGCLYIKHVFIRVQSEGPEIKVEAALLDFEKCRRVFSAQRAAVHDLKQLRRHSSFSDADWAKLLYFYEAAFGSVVKGLE